MLHNSTNESALRKIINFTPNWLQTEVTNNYLFFLTSARDQNRTIVAYLAETT